MQKNDIFEVEITDIGANGEGIGRKDGYTVFIKDTVIGDIIEAKLIKAKKTYGYARLMKILCPSPDRVDPVCSMARKCGGCQIQEMSYKKQLAFKENKVRNNLARIGRVPEATLNRIMDPIVGMKESAFLGAPFYYRNKAQFPIGEDKEGNPVAGFYAGRTHSIIPNTSCALGVEVNERILNMILDFMKEYKIKPYNETAHEGTVRHVLLRYGFRTKEIMVCLVVNADKLPHSEILAERLSEIEGMTSITLNVNKDRTNVILGKEVKLIWGQGYITDYIGDVKYQISPLSFYQVNPVQTERLYRLAVEYAGVNRTEVTCEDKTKHVGEETSKTAYANEEERKNQRSSAGEQSELLGEIKDRLQKRKNPGQRPVVWDLYCGIGTISLFLAKEGCQVYGVEVVPQAVEDAKNNATINGIENVEFILGKVEEVLPAYYEEYEKSHGGKKAYADVIVVDPPRKGCDETLLKTMVEMQPEKIVYVSCDSATLARDVKYLRERGYEIERGRAVDQFPHTVHVETVVKLSLKKDTPKIEVTMEPGAESNYTPAEKATYGKIKEYVKENYGLNVSSLYIAQIKDKCGLDKRDNYNLPKSEDAKVPICPPEKEAAIMDAFRHFGMI